MVGQVQGVFSCVYTGAGWASTRSVLENLPDGSVEVVAEGPKYALEDLEKWCGHGPPAAVVKEVITKWKEPSGEFQTFVINR